MNTRLSICIPTFNRRAYLIETLEALLPEAILYDIPIYISDNHSSDNTVEAVQAFSREQYELIFLTINSKNIGFDSNVLNVVDLASSEYVWLLPDDDLPMVNAISRILKVLDSNYSLLVVNFGTYSKDFSRVIEERCLPIIEDQVIDSGGHEELLEYAYQLTYLGSLVVRRSLWKSVDPGGFCDSGFIHCWVIFNYVIGHTVYILADPVIKQRLQNIDWADSRFELFFLRWPKLIWRLPNGYRPELKTRVTPQFRHRSIKHVIGARAAGWINEANYARYYRDQDISGWRGYLIKGIICQMPRFVSQIIAISYLGSKMLTDRSMRFRYRRQLLECINRL